MCNDGGVSARKGGWGREHRCVVVDGGGRGGVRDGWWRKERSGAPGIRKRWEIGERETRAEGRRGEEKVHILHTELTHRQ